MAVTIREVEYIAELARLEFTPEEKEKLAAELNRILDYMEKLNKLDTSNVEPLSQIFDAHAPLREDRREPSLPREKVLQNAPDATGEFFKVPKVIGD